MVNNTKKKLYPEFGTLIISVKENKTINLRHSGK